MFNHLIKYCAFAASVGCCQAVAMDARPLYEQIHVGSIHQEHLTFDKSDGVGLVIPPFNSDSVQAIRPKLVGIKISLDSASTMSFSLLNQSCCPETYHVVGHSIITLESPYLEGPQLAKVSHVSPADIPGLPLIRKEGDLPTTEVSFSQIFDEQTVDLRKFGGNKPLFFPMTGAGNGSADGNIPFLASFTGRVSATATITYQYQAGFVPGAVIEPSRFLVETHVEEGGIRLEAMADFTELTHAVKLVRWNALENFGRHHHLNLEVAKGVRLNPPDPDLHFQFENSYFLENAELGLHRLSLWVNGHEAGDTFFYVSNAEPFHRWYEDLFHQSTQVDENGGTIFPEIIHLDDADGDGTSDYYEWAFGLNVFDPSDGKMGVTPSLVRAGGIAQLGLRFKRRVMEPPLEFKIRQSSDLKTWTVLNEVLFQEEGEVNEAGLQDVLLISPLGTEEVDSVFWRLQVTEPRNASLVP